MINFLKLFYDKRLSTKEPEHLSFIKGRLAAIKVESPESYKSWSDFYGVDVSVEVKKEPKKEPVRVEKEVVEVTQEEKPVLTEKPKRKYTRKSL